MSDTVACAKNKITCYDTCLWGPLINYSIVLFGKEVVIEAFCSAVIRLYSACSISLHKLISELVDVVWIQKIVVTSDACATAKYFVFV